MGFNEWVVGVWVGRGAFRSRVLRVGIEGAWALELRRMGMGMRVSG